LERKITERGEIDREERVQERKKNITKKTEIEEKRKGRKTGKNRGREGKKNERKGTKDGWETQRKKNRASQPPPQQHHSATVNSSTIEATAWLATSHHLLLLLHSPTPRHLHCLANEQWGVNYNSLSTVHVACEQWRTFTLCIGPDNADLDQKWLGRVWPNLKIKKIFWADVRVILKYLVSSKCCKNTKKKVRKTKWVCFLCIWPSLKKIILYFHTIKIFSMHYSFNNKFIKVMRTRPTFQKNYFVFF